MFRALVRVRFIYLLLGQRRLLIRNGLPIRGRLFFIRGLVFRKVVFIQMPTTNFVSIYVFSRIFWHKLYSCLTLEIPHSYSATRVPQCDKKRIVSAGLAQLVERLIRN